MKALSVKGKPLSDKCKPLVRAEHGYLPPGSSQTKNPLCGCSEPRILPRYGTPENMERDPIFIDIHSLIFDLYRYKNQGFPNILT